MAFYTGLKTENDANLPGQQIKAGQFGGTVGERANLVSVPFRLARSGKVGEEPVAGVLRVGFFKQAGATRSV